MKLYKLSILALALAGTMAACSDDDDYNVAATTPGAYFPSTSPDVVELPLEGSSVDITIARSGVSGDETVNLTTSDPSGLFSVPSTAVFSGNSTTATITVTFDSEKIEMDEEYPVTITIDGAVNSWGINPYEFSFVRKTPLELTELGKGIYASPYFGTYRYEIVKEVNPVTPELETYIVKNWFADPSDEEDVKSYGLDFRITIHNDIILPNGYPYVEIPWTTLKWTNPNYASTVCMGTPEYYKYTKGYDLDFLISRIPDQLSYFDPVKGTFHIQDAYYFFDAAGAFTGYFSGDMQEFLYLPGYPDYDLEIEYSGYFTDGDGNMKAIGQLYYGSDFETVNVYNIAGTEYAEALDKIKNNEVEPAYSYTPDGAASVTVAIDVEGPGVYNLIAVGFADDEMQAYAYAGYEISGTPTVKWESVGTGVYIDGWVMPSYAFNNDDGTQEAINPFEYSWEVKIEKNPEVEGEYRMVSPYTQSGFLLVSNNQNTKATDVVFNIADPDWPYFPFQYIGFTNARGDEWVSDYNWFANEVLGLTKQQVLASPTREPLSSYYENGVIEVRLPLFAINDANKFSSDVDDLGYNWRGPGEDDDPYPCRLTMPSGTKAQTVAKALKHEVCNDAFARSLNRTKLTRTDNWRKNRERNLDKEVRLEANPSL